MPLRVLVAPDKFKGSLTAGDAAQAMARGIRDVFPDAEVVMRPIADGGEGTAETLHATLGGAWITVHGVSDPLGRPIDARYLRLDEEVAVIAMSEASGLWRLRPAEYDPSRTSTFGTGQLIADALSCGARRLLIGLGGSATNDGGAGMAQALGFEFLDEASRPVPPSPSAFSQLSAIRPPATRTPAAEIVGLCDVANPLTGPRGASHVYGPQKGASPALIDALDRGLGHLADIVARDLRCDFRDTPGAGAAGGLGFGLLSFCHAQLKPGFETLAELLGLKQEIAACDLVLTGEGSLDRQTLHGKAPYGVAQLARAHQKPVFALAGRVEKIPELAKAFDRCEAIAPATMAIEEAFAAAPELLRQCTAQVLARWRPGA